MNWGMDEGPKLKGFFEDAANYFGVGKMISGRRVGGNANKNYVVITSSGEFIFKVILEHPREGIETEVAYLNRLKEYDFPAAYYIKSSTGSLIFERDGQILIALPKLDGEPPIPSIEVCHNIGQNIARLNALPDHNLPPRNHWLRRNYLRNTVSLIQSRLPDKAPKVVEAYRALEGFGYNELPKSIIHGDMAPSNCLYKGSELVALLDWEQVGIAPAILDLATCVLNFCFDRNALNAEYYRVLVKGYEQIRALSQAERDSIQPAIRYVGLTLSVWRLMKFGVQYPDPGKMKDYEYYWTMQLDNLKLPTI